MDTLNSTNKLYPPRFHRLLDTHLVTSRDIGKTLPRKHFPSPPKLVAARNWSNRRVEGATARVVSFGGIISQGIIMND